ncbi:hypothetical protein MASR1M107_22560 [Ignavibacteriales bacterium]
MAISDDISNNVIEHAINSLGRNSFTTFHVIEVMEKNNSELILDIKSWSERNWRAIIGKAIKRYSVESNKIKQVSPPNETPARWKKVII